MSQSLSTRGDTVPVHAGAAGERFLGQIARRPQLAESTAEGAATDVLQARALVIRRRHGAPNLLISACF